MRRSAHVAPASRKNVLDLDRIDLQILRLVQENGRISNAELAQGVNVSPVTCHRRTQRLFEEVIGRLLMILNCLLVAGDFDYLLKIRVRDMAPSTACTARP